MHLVNVSFNLFWGNKIFPTPAPHSFHLKCAWNMCSIVMHLVYVSINLFRGTIPSPHSSHFKVEMCSIVVHLVHVSFKAFKVNHDHTCSSYNYISMLMKIFWYFNWNASFIALTVLFKKMKHTSWVCLMLDCQLDIRRYPNTRYCCRKLELFPNPNISNIRHEFSAENSAENVFVVTLPHSDSGNCSH